MIGPWPMERAERLELAREITGRLKEIYGEELKAVGLYGSMGRNTDGPYSDIEIFAILNQDGVELSHEWSYGPGKAEVDIYGADLILRMAAEVDGRWPLTHGAFTAVLPLYDPDGFFPQLRAVVESRTDEQFARAITGVIVGELYEFAGKLRNAVFTGKVAHLPELAMGMAKYGAFLIGLQHRHLFSTGGEVLAEALTLPDRPTGFDELARLVMAGELANQMAVMEVSEYFWAGVFDWADEHGYAITASEQIPF